MNVIDAHTEAMMDISYSARLYELHARLYRRLKFLFHFVSLFSGTAVVASVAGGQDAVAYLASALLAAIPILETLIKPGEKATAFDIYRRKFLTLQAQAMTMDSGAIKSKLAHLYAEPCDEIEALRYVAYNDNVRAHGHDELEQELNRFQRFFALIA